MRKFGLLLFFVIGFFVTASAQKSKDVLSSAHSVYFNIGQSTLTSAAKTTLDGLIERLKKGSKYEVLVYGYADPSGSPALNLKLSTDRINAVGDYLVAKGIPEANVVLKIPRGEDEVRSKYFKGEKDLTNKERRQVELIITPTINQIDPVTEGAPGK